MRLPESLDKLVRLGAEKRGVTPKEIITEVLTAYFAAQKNG